MDRNIFGPLGRYVEDELVSDIDIVDKTIFVTFCSGERIRVCDDLDESFIAGFCQKIANLEEQNFNRMNPLIEAETETLRISILHESVSMGGRSISIRKSLPKVRLSYENAVLEGYASKNLLEFLKTAVRKHMNIVIAGEPGVGKTECAKFLATSIPPEERIITIEDNLEWHLRKINPEGDIVELKVSKDEGVFSYKDAIKASLRQHPKWLMLSEARGVEAKQLIEAWSTGISGMTTIHTDSTSKIPDRILNMIGDYKNGNRLENQIFSDIDMGILIGFYKDKWGNPHRKIVEVRVFARENQTNISDLVVDDGEWVSEGLLHEEIRNKLRTNELLSYMGREAG